MNRRLTTLLTLCASLVPSTALADDFASGSLIIPMDIDYQDDGMLRAYGLVYELLLSGVPVSWAIRSGKAFGEEDFTVSAIDYADGMTLVAAHGYRGGPFVIHQADVGDAQAIVQNWQAENPGVVVHEVTEAFSADVRVHLTVAPTIAMFADGNEDIAAGYLIAAGIPDSMLDYTWPGDSPDNLSIEEVSGPSTVNHSDGALFDEDGDPVYCQLMSMHWGVNAAEDDPEVVAEVRDYLGYNTHFFAECQAVNAFENTWTPAEPYGHFLTPNGFEIGDRPSEYDFYNASTPFAQIDGEFESVGGSEPAYTLPEGDVYLAGDVVMITEAGTPEGVNDVWMTGFLDGACPPSQQECAGAGKVSYLGGHEYSTDLPISENPDTQGARIFLNSLFEAPCATQGGQALPFVTISGPATTEVPTIDYTIDYSNFSGSVAMNARVVEAIPAGTTFVSASGVHTFAAGVIEWDVGNLGTNEAGSVTFQVTLDDFGTYDNDTRLDYSAGLTPQSRSSNTIQTVYAEADETGSSSGTGGESTGGSDGSTGSAGSTGGVSDSGESSDSAGDTGGSESASAGGTDGGSDGGATSNSGGGSGDAGGADAGDAGDAGDDDGGATDGSATFGGDGSAGLGDETTSGCACSTDGDEGPAPLALGFGLFAVVATRRRRRSAAKRSA